EPWVGLKHLATSEDGWSSLYQRPDDKSLWERSYPQGEFHGGGSASFQPISAQDAHLKYGFQ
ncbi:MAG: Imm27 family immunity protein, partial [Novosphingobium sp.]